MPGASLPRSEAEACGILTIDLGALADNWRTALRFGGTAECAAVIKGNAYGTGIVEAAQALARAGARSFFTATISEARTVRTALGAEATIYVLDGLLPDTAQSFAEADLRPVLGSIPEVAEWQAFCATHGDHPAALHVDTGMNRLGIHTDQLSDVLSSGWRPALVMTHMACADEPDHPLNDAQIARFEEVRRALPGVPASLANSASTVYLKCAANYDLTRPGIGLYGGEPIEGYENPMRPVVRLDAPTLLVRNVRAGETVGYGATWTAQRDSRIAVVGVGYADGFHRTATAKGDEAPYRVSIGGQRAPLAGRVNMDLLTIDVTDHPDVQRGTPVTLIGGDIPLSETAAHFGTIVYEVLTGLGQRYARRYVTGS